MSFEVKILGSNSATPVFNRHQTAQVLIIENEHFLIDCGEGTQMQLSRYRIKQNKINYIFISHLHGDHYLGLVGLISTMHLFGRSKELHIFGPPGLMEIITVQLRFSETVLSYKVHFHEIDTEANKVILETPTLTVETIPLVHRIRCSGFFFKEKPKKPRLRKELIPESLSLQQVALLKKGLDLEDEQGNILIKNSEVTNPPKRSRSYAYMSDTAYNETYLDLVSGCDLLYHEATFLHEMQVRARETFHTTTIDAATFAKKAKVDKLLIGHFSSRYRELTPMLEEARSVFDNTYLALEGESFFIED